MTVLVTGSRTWEDEGTVLAALVAVQAAAGAAPVLLHGGAAGADLIAARLAKSLGWETRAFALTGEDWRKYGRAAGPLRNKRMLDAGPDLVLAFWDGMSKGTAGVIAEADRRGIPVSVFREAA